MTTLKPDAFEEIFLKLEEESERRALAAEEAMPSPNVPDQAIAARQERQRSRGSISISRFGHIEDGTQQQTSPGLPPPTFVHGMTTFTPFYGMQSHVCLSLAGTASPEPLCWADAGFVAQNPSADSLSADSFFGDDAGLSAESDHVTQVHRIAGRQSLPRSVGGILQRTLTRSWTSGALSLNDVSNSSVVVGVVVEEDHREEPEPREGLFRRAMVHAPSTLRPQVSRATIPGAERRETNGSWRSRAGELFKRKTRPPRSTLWPSQKATS